MGKHQSQTSIQLRRIHIYASFNLASLHMTDVMHKRDSKYEYPANVAINARSLERCRAAGNQLRGISDCELVNCNVVQLCIVHACI